MNENQQNSCLMVTNIDEQTGKYVLTYIPLNIDYSILKFFLENGTCTNNKAIYFKLDSTGEQYWEEMWKQLEECCE